MDSCTLCYFAAHHESSVPIGFCLRCCDFWWQPWLLFSCVPMVLPWLLVACRDLGRLPSTIVWALVAFSESEYVSDTAASRADAQPQPYCFSLFQPIKNPRKTSKWLSRASVCQEILANLLASTVARWLENTWCTNQSNSSPDWQLCLAISTQKNSFMCLSGPHVQCRSLQATPEIPSIGGVLYVYSYRPTLHIVRKEQTGLGRPDWSARYTYHLPTKIEPPYHLMEWCTFGDACWSRVASFSSWCRVLPSTVFYTLQAFTTSTSSANTSFTGPKVTQNQGW